MDVLNFSGGIDSLALLFVMRKQWPELAVLWVDTGAVYPGIHEYIAKVAAVVQGDGGRFESVQGEQPNWQKRIGIAVDVVPFRYTVFGRGVHGTTGQGPLYTTTAHCCHANIWRPLYERARALDAQVIYRGQKARRHEDMASPIDSRTVTDDGIEIRFPLEEIGWSRADVFDYCRRECPELIPSYYAAGEEVSRDCWDCIGYLQANQYRLRHMPTPEMQDEIDRRLRDYSDALEEDFALLRSVMPQERMSHARQ